MKAPLAYLAPWGPCPGPLFAFQEGSLLSRSLLVMAVRSALEFQALDVRGFNGHSFRSGAVTTAAACGMEDSLIQSLGRWKS